MMPSFGALQYNGQSTMSMMMTNLKTSGGMPVT